MNDTAASDSIEDFVNAIGPYVEWFSSHSSPHRLLRVFCSCLKSTSASELKLEVARAWVVWGALQMYCAFPSSSLDPSIVNAFKIAITRDEASQFPLVLLPALDIVT